MTDEEKRVDEEIQSHLKKVYGFSEDQLLKEVEAAEKSVNDLDFSGAEDRIYERMLERRAEKEKKEEKVRKSEPDELFETVMPDGPVVSIVADKSDAENTDKEKSPVRKAVRFKKKTFLLVAAVAAVLALMVGSTAIGEKNYFFRRVGDGVNHAVAIDNDKNKVDASKIEEAYKDIDEKLDIQVLRLGYIPKELYFEELVVTNKKALIIFDYNGNKIYFIQECRDKETSIGPQSDRKKGNNEVYNDWIKQTVSINENLLDEGCVEYSVEIYTEKSQYRLMGVMEKEEFKKVIKYLFLS